LLAVSFSDFFFCKSSTLPFFCIMEYQSPINLSLSALGMFQRQSVLSHRAVAQFALMVFLLGRIPVSLLQHSGRTGLPRVMQPSTEWAQGDEGANPDLLGLSLLVWNFYTKMSWSGDNQALVISVCCQQYNFWPVREVCIWGGGLVLSVTLASSRDSATEG
jgi:hypothetical protein